MLEIIPKNLEPSCTDSIIVYDYNETLAEQAEGGTPPYTWEEITGDNHVLPPGLTLNADGTITGSIGSILPQEYIFNVRVTDALNDTAEALFSILIDQTPRFIGADEPIQPSGRVGEAYYGHGFLPFGSPYIIEVSSGSLPPGLSFDGSNFIIVGTPTTAGIYTFVLSITNDFGLGGAPCSSTKMFSILIEDIVEELPEKERLDIETNIIDTCSTSEVLTELVASGGTPSYTWMLGDNSQVAEEYPTAIRSLLYAEVLDNRYFWELEGYPGFSYTEFFSNSLLLIHNMSTDAVSPLEFSANYNNNGTLVQHDFSIPVEGLKLIPIYLPIYGPFFEDAGPYNWNLTDGTYVPHVYMPVDNRLVIQTGTIPTGMSLEGPLPGQQGDYSIEGTPTQRGIYEFEFSYETPSGLNDLNTKYICYVSRPRSEFEYPALSLSTYTFFGSVGITFNESINQFCEISEGILPPGLSIDIEGHITGIPETAGAWACEILTGLDPETGDPDPNTTAIVLFKIFEQTTIVDPIFPSIEAGNYFYYELPVITDLSTIYRSLYIVGDLPEGIIAEFYRDKILFVGIPTTAGTYDFTIQLKTHLEYFARFDSHPAEYALAVSNIVSCSLLVEENTGNIIPPGMAGLPPDLTLSSDGILSGELVLPISYGIYTFTVTVTDSNNYTFTKNLYLDVHKTPEFDPLAPSERTEGLAYTSYLDVLPEVSNSGEYLMTVTDGSLPPGLSLVYTPEEENIYTIRGTPTTPGTYIFTLTVSSVF